MSKIYTQYLAEWKKAKDDKDKAAVLDNFLNNAEMRESVMNNLGSDIFRLLSPADASKHKLRPDRTEWVKYAHTMPLPELKKLLNAMTEGLEELNTQNSSATRNPQRVSDVRSTLFELVAKRETEKFKQAKEKSEPEFRVQIHAKMPIERANEIYHRYRENWHDATTDAQREAVLDAFLKDPEMRMNLINKIGNDIFRLIKPTDVKTYNLRPTDAAIWAKQLQTMANPDLRKLITEMTRRLEELTATDSTPKSISVARAELFTMASRGSALAPSAPPAPNAPPPDASAPSAPPFPNAPPPDSITPSAPPAAEIVFTSKAAAAAAGRMPTHAIMPSQIYLDFQKEMSKVATEKDKANVIKKYLQSAQIMSTNDLKELETKITEDNVSGPSEKTVQTFLSDLRDMIKQRENEEDNRNIGPPGGL